MGSFFHVCLWRELLRSAGSADVDFIDQIMSGMPIVGDIASSRQIGGLIRSFFLSVKMNFRDSLLTSVRAARSYPTLSEGLGS